MRFDLQDDEVLVREARAALAQKQILENKISGLNSNIDEMLRELYKRKTGITITVHNWGDLGWLQFRFSFGEGI